VARLLGHHTTSAISEYETGRLLPNLRTALKLAVIYGAPLKELYAPLWGEVEQEVAGRRGTIPSGPLCTPKRAPYL